MKKIALSLMTIAAVLVMAVGATRATFSDDKVVAGNTFATGEVKIGQTWQLPMTVTGLYPGAQKDSGVFAVQYVGSLKGDLYYGLKHTPGYDNLEDVLNLQIEKVDAEGNHIGWVYQNWTSVKYPFQYWTKVGEGLNPGEWAYFKLHVQMTPEAGNSYQGKTAVNDVVLYAVQEGGSTPKQIPYGYVEQ